MSLGILKLGDGSFRILQELGELGGVSFGILKLGDVRFSISQMSWVMVELGELWNLEVR